MNPSLSDARVHGLLLAGLYWLSVLPLFYTNIQEEHSRRSISIQQNVPVAQFLRIRTVLQVLLQRVLPDVRRLADGADGCLVDDGSAVDFCHLVSLDL